MTLNPVEIKLINTRQDTIDFIYFCIVFMQEQITVLNMTVVTI